MSSITRIVFLCCITFPVFGQNPKKAFYKKLLKTDAQYSCIGIGYKLITFDHKVSDLKIPSITAGFSFGRIYVNFGAAFLHNTNKLFYDTSVSPQFIKSIPYKYELFEYDMGAGYKLKGFAIGKSIFNIFAYAEYDFYQTSLIDLGRIARENLSSNEHYFFKQMYAKDVLLLGLFIDKNFWIKNTEFIIRAKTNVSILSSARKTDYFSNSGDTYGVAPKTPFEISFLYNIFPVNTINPLKLKSL